MRFLAVGVKDLESWSIYRLYSDLWNYRVDGAIRRKIFRMKRLRMKTINVLL